ncbi:MAG: nitroreductase [Alphaproteobacteria bacterium]|nr:nitroreductase [Alphaproteobacteria bacterium]
MTLAAERQSADPLATPESEIVDRAIESRHSLRGFLPKPVPRATVETLLRVAARAPSGTNMQPWRVRVLVGAAKEQLSKAILEAHFGDSKAHAREFKYYPDEFFEPYLSRRRKVGWDLYALCGIKKGDTGGMHRQSGRNYVFFDAPVGMIFTIDRRLEIGSWLDYGMFMQNIMVAARGRGLDTCPQVAFASYHKVIRQVLNIPDSEVVMCGMSLGYADPVRPENALTTERAPLSDWVRFDGD